MLPRIPGPKGAFAAVVLLIIGCARPEVQAEHASSPALSASAAAAVTSPAPSADPRSATTDPVVRQPSVVPPPTPDYQEPPPVYDEPSVFLSDDRHGSSSSTGVVGSSSEPSVRARPVSPDWGCKLPTDAEKAGVGDAMLTVDAHGGVVNVQVLTDPGYGVGQAARECAKRAAFVPAKDAQGRALEDTVRVRVHLAPHGP